MQAAVDSLASRVASATPAVSASPFAAQRIGAVQDGIAAVRGARTAVEQAEAMARLRQAVSEYNQIVGAGDRIGRRALRQLDSTSSTFVAQLAVAKPYLLSRALVELGAGSYLLANGLYGLYDHITTGIIAAAEARRRAEQAGGTSTNADSATSDGIANDGAVSGGTGARDDAAGSLQRTVFPAAMPDGAVQSSVTSTRQAGGLERGDGQTRQREGNQSPPQQQGESQVPQQQRKSQPPAEQNDGWEELQDVTRLASAVESSAQSGAQARTAAAKPGPDVERSRENLGQPDGIDDGVGSLVRASHIAPPLALNYGQIKKVQHLIREYREHVIEEEYDEGHSIQWWNKWSGVNSRRVLGVPTPDGQGAETARTFQPAARRIIRTTETGDSQRIVTPTFDPVFIRRQSELLGTARSSGGDGRGGMRIGRDKSNSATGQTSSSTDEERLLQQFPFLLAARGESGMSPGSRSVFYLSGVEHQEKLSTERPGGQIQPATQLVSSADDDQMLAGVGSATSTGPNSNDEDIQV